MNGMTPADPDDEIAAPHPYRLAARRSSDRASTIVELGGDRRIGGDGFAVIAGPCAVETREQTLEIARVVRDAGGTMLRGGAYKPRTSPYAFQGLGGAGLQILADARAETGLPIVTELMDVRDVEAVVGVADMIQIGARNMQNYALLTEVGRTRVPVLLKRGLSSTIEELLMAAEYVLKEGNADVVLCERGIRTFETAYRFTLDLAAVAVLKSLTHLPVIVDPSHAAGRRDLVEPLALAAAAVGADGIVVEIHPDPDSAICDGPQTLRCDDFARFAARVEQVAVAAGKRPAMAAAAV
jgi:3-deoxy-7-phosphoheptulonate synthase